MLDIPMPYVDAESNSFAASAAEISFSVFSFLDVFFFPMWDVVTTSVVKQGGIKTVVNYKLACCLIVKLSVSP